MKIVSVYNFSMNEYKGRGGFFDVAVVLAIFPVAEVVIVQRLAEQSDIAVLGGVFNLADFIHFTPSSI